MKVKEGPAFGGLLIGMGLAFLLNQKTGSLALSLLVGTLVGLADYFVLAWVAKRKEARK